MNLSTSRSLPQVRRLNGLRAALLIGLLASGLSGTAAEAVSRDPNGVNVNAQGATTVFITFGGLQDQVPVEATWCGELVDATPDIGMKCNPATIFGRLPLRFDQSRLDATGSSFTDIMSIPASVSRRAYQAATRGEDSRFFYVRRFTSTSGGPDEYVFVTCRMTGGGARTPLALVDVRVQFEGGEEDATVTSIRRGNDAPELSAEITYTGTGRLQGRWEVVLPSDEPPTSRDLLTEATLPADERPLQRRYTQVGRFNIFLPPTGRVKLEGPDPSFLPTDADGLYQVLLRVEASADKEADSNLAKAEAGNGVVHSGAVAGFPMPVLRYFVGSQGKAPSGFDLLAPQEGARVSLDEALTFAWNQTSRAHLYRLELASEGDDEKSLFSAVLQQGIGLYRPPALALDQHVGRALRWRVVAIDAEGKAIDATPWRTIVLLASP